MSSEWLLQKAPTYLSTIILALYTGSLTNRIFHYETYDVPKKTTLILTRMLAERY